MDSFDLHMPNSTSNNSRKSILSQIRKENNKEKMDTRQKVESLRPNTIVKHLELVILRIYPRRLISSSNYTGPVAAACGRDETGIVGLVLWDDQIELTRVGDIIKIENGWCRQRDGELVVSTGKSGKIRILDR